VRREFSHGTCSRVKASAGSRSHPPILKRNEDVALADLKRMDRRSDHVAITETGIVSEFTVQHHDDVRQRLPVRPLEVERGHDG
jgi:hypothetical protein